MGEKYRRKPDIVRVLDASDMDKRTPPWEEDVQRIERPCASAFPGRLLNEWLVVIDSVADVMKIHEETGKEVCFVEYDGEPTICIGRTFYPLDCC